MRARCKLLPMALAEQIEAAERDVWQALLTGDIAADQALLAEDFLGVYPDGVSDRAGHAEQLRPGPSIADYRLDRVQVRAVGPDHALIAYHARYRRVAAAEEAMWVSSLWRRDGGGWINIFSQDTPVGGAVP